MNNQELCYAILKLTDVDNDVLMWGTGADGEVAMYVNCSDVFDWGTADAEEITENDLADIQKAIDDIRSVTDNSFLYTYQGFYLWAARKRGQRPQGAYYKYLKQEIADLFNEVGADRDITLLNPYDQQGLYKFTC